VLEGSFPLASDTRIYSDAASSETAQYLVAHLAPATGWHFQVGGITAMDFPAFTSGILLTTNGADPNLGSEGYALTVGTNRVTIRAPAPAGLFYGVQTFLQLLPPAIFSRNTVSNADWRAPCVQIEDWPRFKWRGLMLDVSRHFFTKQEVEQMLDAMALHKLNTFHWHLADDQGWRIEIKQYPKLTSVGAWRSGVGFQLDPKSTTAYGPDGRYGGFYTQDDIREVVGYAQKLHITIVPEIEMPGHSVAALAAYPELSCSGQPQSTDVGGGVNAGVYCAGREETFEFLQNVLTEVFALFPSPYIHIGGDEVPKDNWKKCPLDQARMKQEGLANEEELQAYFIRRIGNFVTAHGRTMIGWSENLQGGLAPNAVVMDWNGGGLEAASAGHDVVMTPTSNCYFDYAQSRGSRG
jgi:hexosaminidase